MSTDQAVIDRITRAQDKHTEALLRLPNVIGTALGVKMVNDEPTGDLALVVLVRHKVPLESLKPNERIPATLDGVPVDVQEVGDVLAF
ncbi:hypothetical protein VZO05_14240 [Aggregatilineales bacterium SYSU G02658]